MRNVTIFGNFTILETFMLNGVQVDKGFDERLDIFYRVNFCIENSEDSFNDTFIDCYYRNIDDFKKDMGNYIG
ncbi:hypothetical protein [Clostridium thermarum]|uniref:hypothetical protein n=1 Tax=Clostridium thermarum TaxID=1716543 RepID=UPI0011230E67|nr:hypothetical protein [Clostridium thermarum]